MMKCSKNLRSCMNLDAGSCLSKEHCVHQQMTADEAIDLLSTGANSSIAITVLITEYLEGKERQHKMERAIHGLVKDIEAVEKVIRDRKTQDGNNLVNFLKQGEGV